MKYTPLHMFLTVALSTTGDTLAFNVREYGTTANRDNKKVTDLVIVTYNSANVSINCTFSWTITATIKVPAYSYNSGCIEGSAASTATISDFLKFNTIDLLYNKTLYLSINSETALKLGFAIDKLFAGTLPGYQFPLSTPPVFSDVTIEWCSSGKANDDRGGFESTPFSTVAAGIFIANFSGNYNYTVFTVTDLNNSVKCTMIFTASLNEAICSLGMLFNA
jgi:hypothetical protein